MDDPKRAIRFCVNNPRSLAEREDLLRRGFDCKGCLGNCDQCFETRYLEIDNRFIPGDSYDEILNTPTPE